jgi:hypothetical protein
MYIKYLVGAWASGLSQYIKLNYAVKHKRQQKKAKSNTSLINN